ncbi:MAG: tRNA adenosine(34) deaminase TadA [Oscillospiraceae bacterium]|nr:tRNA adenosine(34) deaminase TadA [Oscillospiraceae bacterium]
MSEQDILFMKLALNEAKKASDIGEVPVGAVIVRDGEVISTAYNRRECDKNAISHAEIMAISKACEKLGGWRLHQCELYVTLEPCPMCTGAIINSRIKRVVFGAYDKKAGCMGSILNLTEYPFNHKPEIEGGVLADEAGALLSEFFKNLRKRDKK